MHTHRSAAGLANALRDLADRLDKTPVRPLSPVWLSVGVQAVRSSGGVEASQAERGATVDALAAALDLGAPEVTRSGQYSTGDRDVCGLSVTAYTGLDESDAIKLRGAEIREANPGMNRSASEIQAYREVINQQAADYDAANPGD